MRKLLFTICDEKYRPILEETEPLFKLYADKYGYNYEVMSEQYERHINWQKVSHFLDVYDNYDIILYCDADIVFINFNEDIADYLDNDIGFVAPEIANMGKELNTGLYCVRTTEYAKNFFSDWWYSQIQKYKWDDNRALVKIKKKYKIQILPEKWNRFFFQDRKMTKGGNIYHIAGGWSSRKPIRQAKLIKRIKTHFGVNDVIHD